jgi:glycosyltransferase involved in cell wall biosynthesis
MAEGLGIEPVYIHGGKGVSLPVRYWRQWRQTGVMLRKKRPSTVLVMQPPFFSLLRAWIYTLTSGAKLAADMHTGAFDDPRWKWATPLILRIARAGDNRVILTNRPLARRAEAKGATVLVCHGYLRSYTAPASQVFEDQALAKASEGAFVLVPLAWAYDEPVEEILQAARLTPEISWVLTGKAPQSARDSAPANVTFTGFAARPDYELLRARASVVGAITTAEDTMQRSGYEALEVNTPLVTSPMVVLKEYFEDRAVYAEPRAASIAEAMRTALADGDVLRAGMADLLTTKIVEQEAALAAIRSWIND